MQENNFKFQYWQEAATALVVIVSVFGLFGLLLWTNLPFNCSLDECSLSTQLLSQQRQGLLLRFAPIASALLLPGLVLLVHDLRNPKGLISRPGRLALLWPALSLLLPVPIRILFAASGIGISILALGLGLNRSLKSKSGSRLGYDFLALGVNVAWCLFTYFFLLSFWEIFGD